MQFFPLLTALLLAAPVATGLLGTLLPALGYLPALGGDKVSLAPFYTLFATPELARAAGVSLFSGAVSTLASLALAVLAMMAGARVQPLRRGLPVALATPHIAVALGFAFLIAPSGWVTRFLSPWLTGWTQPPDLLTANDPWGLVLAAGLVLKEAPFLWIVLIAACNQIPVHQLMRTARSLGYGPMQGWLKIVLPQVYPQIRLPVYAVLAYALSNVEMALILGPSTPPTLAVLILRWATNPDLSYQFLAAAGALLQLALVIVMIGVWRLFEMMCTRLGRHWIEHGKRGGMNQVERTLTITVWNVIGFVFALSLGSMAVWSLAQGWFFPSFLPDTWTLDTWAHSLNQIVPLTLTTFCIAILVSFLALALSIGCLENEPQRGQKLNMGWIYLPLLLPQISVMFGFQVLLSWLRLDGTWVATILAHLVFVLPYVFLVLADPYRALDVRYRQIAAGLGQSRQKTFFRIVLPLLLRPVLLATAVGAAVSAGLYLPTLFAGAGRFETLATEALSLSTGADRRIIGVHVVLLASLPLVGFGLALGIPAWLYRHRKGMQPS